MYFEPKIDNMDWLHCIDESSIDYENGEILSYVYKTGGERFKELLDKTFKDMAFSDE